jgi:hypothetical protein
MTTVLGGKKRRTWRMTEQEYQEHVDSYNGVCLSCGEVRYGDTEWDASGYPCDACGKDRVIGIENAMIEDRIIILT